MKHTPTLLIAAVLFAVCAPSRATMIYQQGPLSITALDSDCSSDDAKKVLAESGAMTPPKRADVMLAGQFIPACWAEDKDHDVIVIDRKGSGGVIFRRAFRQLKEV
jgi:hypothetical protein